jgi:dihydroorotate dehydrogenase
MRSVYRTIFDLAFRPMDPELAHHLVFEGLALAGRTPIVADVVQGALAPYLGQGAGGRGSVKALGQTFPAPFGLAAGFDKNAGAVRGLAMLGFALGFNNDGAEAAAKNLRKIRSTAAGRAIKIGVNIGKNKTTPAETAADDYAICARILAPYADYLVVNVSSPNTPGLRDLQAVDSLRPILEATLAAAGDVPVLVKIAPDLPNADIDAIADLGLELGLAGFVAVNTTIGHELGPGGLSGPPEMRRGLEVVERLRARINASEAGQSRDVAIIGCGGITTADDARDYLDAGADLVQGYTGFIYQGPLWPSRINRELTR